jgi:hypothetical protein
MINVQVKGLDQLLPKIASLPDELEEQVMTHVGEYSLEVVRDQQPPQRHVSRADAYPDAPAGPGWFSDRQRRWFFAALASGELQTPYRRTGTLAQGWRLEKAGDGFTLTNDVPYAHYVQGFAFQSRHEGMVGWKKVNQVIDSYLNFRNSKFRDAANEGVREALRKVKIE